MTGKSPALKARRIGQKLPFECVALLLQGGGALGAYQAGAYAALSESGIEPTWLAGISIGAVNAALIAGNVPGKRAEHLRAFWEAISDGGPVDWAYDASQRLVPGEEARRVVNQASALRTLVAGVPGFFTPRVPPPWFSPSGTLGATSVYDTKALGATLERWVDFDRINARSVRFSVGAVNVRSGNLVYFDNHTHVIDARHIMASAALPPGFPAVDIDGEKYWDGGLVSNTPLQWVVEQGPCVDTLIFQIDLWSARGVYPRNLPEVMTRHKEIQYSSRTRANTDWVKHMKKLHCALATLLPKLPESLKDTPEVKALNAAADRNVYNIIHLIYRAQTYEGYSKDFEFSRLSMREHWRAGYNDAVRTLRHPEALQRPSSLEAVCIFDLAVDGRE